MIKGAMIVSVIMLAILTPYFTIADGPSAVISDLKYSFNVTDLRNGTLVEWSISFNISTNTEDILYIPMTGNIEYLEVDSYQIISEGDLFDYLGEDRIIMFSARTIGDIIPFIKIKIEPGTNKSIVARYKLTLQRGEVLLFQSFLPTTVNGVTYQVPVAEIYVNQKNVRELKDVNVYMESSNSSTPSKDLLIVPVIRENSTFRAVIETFNETEYSNVFMVVLGGIELTDVNTLVITPKVYTITAEEYSNYISINLKASMPEIQGCIIYKVFNRRLSDVSDKIVSILRPLNVKNCEIDPNRIDTKVYIDVRSEIEIPKQGHYTIVFTVLGDPYYVLSINAETITGTVTLIKYPEISATSTKTTTMTTTTTETRPPEGGINIYYGVLGAIIVIIAILAIIEYKRSKSNK